MYSYSYYHGPNPVVTVILFLIALVGGICAYLMFVKSDEEPKDPRLLKLKEFLSFKKMIIEGLLKATYIIFALFVTLYSFEIMISTSFITGLMLLILLNIMLRIGYEASLIVLLIWRNTSDISKKLGKVELKEGHESEVKPESESRHESGHEFVEEPKTKVEAADVKTKVETGLESDGHESGTKIEEPVVKTKPRTRKPKTTEEKETKKPAKKKTTTKKTSSKKAKVEEVKVEEPSTKEEGK